MKKLRTASDIILSISQPDKAFNFYEELLVVPVKYVEEMIETAQRDTLEAAAENATTMDDGGYNGIDEWVINIVVDKSSILNLLNDEK